MSSKHKHKKLYKPPKLLKHGRITELTSGSSGAFMDGMGTQQSVAMGGMMSDRRNKENILQIARHPLGIGLYSFDYKPAYRDSWGYGQQFGVMADEVKQVLPLAVSTHDDGYKVVDYRMLAAHALWVGSRQS